MLQLQFLRRSDVVRLACYCLPVNDEDEKEHEEHNATMITLLIVVHEMQGQEKAKEFALVLTFAALYKKLMPILNLRFT